jgi:hypothetical protein
LLEVFLVNIDEQNVYIDPTDESVAALFRRQIKGELVMLNLLRFRPVADYTGFPDLAPTEDISGRDAYKKYMDHTLPFLQASGGSLEFVGTGGEFLIGPTGKGWDMVLLIRQKSVDSFLAFAMDQEYLKGIGHRVAAIQDSRIIPLEDSDGLAD